ncbi:iron-siderophore ABC transporter substrate-binding protein [Pseudoroseicyclus aestuarii]|uniref:Iron complex transport system substrate-binding protein n=1 Tax=Pseudoroseicyclus aestuarii TaxID=1795041 RepID=A0A318ST61_9RHOB|nr:iron-siderophore ABC transporter substrate-binding protein [Pseudoroseicyclus aestuarii]PYE81317.1 iron complex transport system substrate-binding protein [Pseudoroseicyclus aestuarii]
MLLTRIFVGTAVSGVAIGAAGVSQAQDGRFPVTIKHAFGNTTIEAAPERIATVNWGNHEVPLALGVVPVGFVQSTWGDEDGDGLMPWVAEALEELGAEVPALFDEGDGIDFEAVAATEPDVILAMYSGISENDYTLLNEIAPTIAYPETAWTTSWREMIEMGAAAIGMTEEGEALIADIEQDIADAVAAHPELEGKTAMYITHVDTTDLSTISFYSGADPRVDFLQELGLTLPQAVIDAGEAGQYNGSVSAERIDLLNDVDIGITYAGQELVDTLEADPLTAQLPVVAKGGMVTLGGGTLGAAANPTPLGMQYTLDIFVDRLAEAASGAE